MENNIPTIINDLNQFASSDAKLKIINDDVYIIGLNNNQVHHAGYYKNGIYFPFPNSNFINLAVNNNQLYTIDNYNYNYSIINNLTTNSVINLNVRVNEIFFDNNDVYYYDLHNIYKNGNLIYTLDGGNIVYVKVKMEIFIKLKMYLLIILIEIL